MKFKQINSRISEMLPRDCSGDEPDYTVAEEMRVEWEQLSSVMNSAILVFDCHTNTFIYVGGDYMRPYGITPHDLITRGHIPVLEIMHPDDINLGLLIREKVYAYLAALPADKRKEYKLTHEFRVRNLNGEWVRVIEQEQVLCTYNNGSPWLMLSVVDIDASHEMESVKSHLYNFVTGEQIFFDLSDVLTAPLTSQEKRILKMMDHGLLSKEIAAKLNISINTVNSHRQNILRKLNANNSIEAVNLARKLGLGRE